MKNRVLLALMGILLIAAPASAQDQPVTGKVTSEQGAPMQGVQVVIKGTTAVTITNASGDYSIRVQPGQVLQYRFIGHAPVERTVGAERVINVTLKRTATQLDAMVVSALGQTTTQRALGTAQQTVEGVAIAQTQRENFLNALQGRVAGVEVTSTSGVPGASTSITIRGVSSISSNNQPLMIVDGLPIDNKTFNTNVMASDAPGSTTAFNNRGVDFTNRAADLNPEDIESLVVLKGPEASALYGIDAANGAIVITTKRGRAGVGGLEYSTTFRMDRAGRRPSLQRTYGATVQNPDGSIGSFQYFGAPYADTTTFYDNVSGFFQPAMTQKHNLTFNGAAPDNRINYRLGVSSDKQEGVVPNSRYGRVNLTGASQAQVNDWLRADLTMNYAYSDNDQAWKGTDGPLIGLLVWPQTDNARDFLSPAGTRRRITSVGLGETDNPYFNVEKNRNRAVVSRLISNVGLVITPFKWGSLKTNIGVDGYTTENSLLRHPESAFAATVNGVLDVVNDVVRNVNAQTLLNINRYELPGGVGVSGLVGNQVSDFKSIATAVKGQDFLDPNFVSVNNTTLRFNRTVQSQRRLMSLFGQATFDWRDYLYVTVTGRNDWTSTIPQDRNSFFYPSISSSFIFSDAFPSVAKYVTGKVRAAYAEVGKDARPYAFLPSLEYKTTSYGGYGYGFTGPNVKLRPEFATSYEFGTELGFLDDRLGLDVTWYRKQTKDQIVNDIRGSYGTGFILFNLNGASTRNTGMEITARGTPMARGSFTWDVVANFESTRGEVVALPNDLPESYVSDTWLYGNIRNGTQPGLSTRSLTGRYLARNNAGELLIDPTTGLPVTPAAAFFDRGYDRQPDFTLGLTNTFRYGRATLSVLFDIRRGGDILNATEHFLTARGLSRRTLDREQPRVIRGVLRDGLENTATPTRNTIVVTPSIQNGFYTLMSEELFIEESINWFRLRDITIRYELPDEYVRVLRGRSASVFFTGTDLFLATNYSGLDPIVNGNTAAVGGSGAAGIDYGNFPMPRGFSFGLKVGF